MLTLSDGVRLDVSVVVLAGPHKAALALESLGYHVVYQPVLIPDALGLILRLVLTERGRKERRREGVRCSNNIIGQNCACTLILD